MACCVERSSFIFFGHFCQYYLVIYFFNIHSDLNINIWWQEWDLLLKLLKLRLRIEFFFLVSIVSGFLAFEVFLFLFLMLSVLISIYWCCFCMILSRAHAKLVYACEWNPHAIEALRHNLQSNSVAERCIVIEGDNRNTAPKVYWCIVFVLVCLLPFVCG